MNKQKVTPNYLGQITRITPRDPPEKNQQSAGDAADERAGGLDGSDGDAADDEKFAGDMPAGETAPLSAISTSTAVELGSHGAGVGAALMRLLHEDGGGKKDTPPDFAQSLAKLCDAGHPLAQWAARYLAIKVCGRSTNTVAAKARDLATFIKWFVGEHGHGEIAGWVPRDTRRFMTALNDAGRQPTTINRALYTLKHFARWVHEQPGGVFARFGLPVAEVEPYGVDEVDCKKLTAEQVAAVFASAQAAVTKTSKRATKRRGQGRAVQGASGSSAVDAQDNEQGRLAETRARPRRNLAVLGMLYYTGLRVSEVVTLKRDQYDGECLHDVERKGGRRARKIILHPECIRLVDYYLEYERGVDVDSSGDDSVACLIDLDAVKPLFVTARAGKPLDRFGVRDMLAKLALATGLTILCGGKAVPMTLHPHQLRHTFGALYREASGSDTETAAALGHAGLQYVGRYVRKTDNERIGLLQSALTVPRREQKM